MIIGMGYLVLGCGCTDCFPQAIFFDEAAAEEYGKKHCCNPEGFIVKPIDISPLEIDDD